MNFESPFDFPVKFLRYLGFFLEYDTNRRGFLQKCLTVYSLLSLFVLISFFISEAYQSIRNIEEFARRIINCYACCEAFVYVFTYCVWRKKFKFLMDDIMDILRTDSSTNTGDIARLRRFTVKFMKILTFVIFTTLCSEVLPSLFDFIINGNRQFPLNIGRYCNITESPFYELAYVTIVWVGIVANYSILFYGTIYLTIGLLLVMALNNIRKGLMQMKEDNFDLDKFKEIAQRHVRACEYFEKFSDLCRPSILVKSITIATSLCVYGFVLLEVGVRNDNLWNMIHAILGFLLVNAGIATLLIIGTMISTESAQIDKVLYDVFLDVPKTVHKDIQIMMSRSQKKLILKAWFFQATIDTLKDGIKAAYSYFTLLQALK